MAQIELLCAFFDRTEQTLQASTKIRSLADIRLGLRVVAAQQEHGGSRGDGSENLRIAFRGEFQALSQHEIILVPNHQAGGDHIEKAGSQPSVESPECVSRHYRHD